MTLDIPALAGRSGLPVCAPFDPATLAFAPRVRASCVDNRCGHYGRNYMCPPSIDSLRSLPGLLAEFDAGWLLQRSEAMDVAHDPAGLTRSKLGFHRSVLELEARVQAAGHPEALGFMGGCCVLCEPCALVTLEPCPHPAEARISLEGLGVDVLGLLERAGLDPGFHPDRVTWVGCLLIRQRCFQAKA